MLDTVSNFNGFFDRVQGRFVIAKHATGFGKVLQSRKVSLFGQFSLELTQKCISVFHTISVIASFEEQIA